MLVDFDIDKFSGKYLIKFNLDQFKGEADYKMAITIVTCVSLDYDLDPEIEVGDIQDICDKTEELGKDVFTFEIGDDGIEVDI
ncbi:hypothetical protein HBN50_08280 [Halobacteriovorax sp. GB3]|uniref:hypothetical protein n=1 Tax=Halobacteriovorax sp. GB3 TaxID=2719615 RepID=UPI00235E1819|nr:hypothetical protein [Halobacteriovorax sp. GB3]MDD0853090.1 hypothetical protein [Halobacteriovorax sp. GB3]